MLRHILGITDEERQLRRDQILSTKISDFKRFADALEAVKSDKSLVVAVASPEAVANANSQRADFLTPKSIL
jgi:Zn-dependent M16 (insulinase) family peptidase